MGQVVPCDWYRCPHCGFLDLTKFRFCPNHELPRPLFEAVPPDWESPLWAAYAIGGMDAARELASLIPEQGLAWVILA